MTFAIPRRTFLIGLGLSTGTLVLGLRPARAAKASGFAPSPFIHVAPDGQVTIVSHRCEMGQGTRSTLPALVADEMGASWDRVRVVQADGDPIYGEQSTDGSASIRDATEPMRKLGAAATSITRSCTCRAGASSASRCWPRPRRGSQCRRTPGRAPGPSCAASAGRCRTSTHRTS
jgi:isoquinoline 1-oxidoreductase beta subunit